MRGHCLKPVQPPRQEQDEAAWDADLAEPEMPAALVAKEEEAAVTKTEPDQPDASKPRADDTPRKSGKQASIMRFFTPTKKKAEGSEPGSEHKSNAASSPQGRRPVA